MADTTRIEALKNQALRAFEGGEIDKLFASYEALLDQHAHQLRVYHQVETVRLALEATNRDLEANTQKLETNVRNLETEKLGLEADKLKLEAEKLGLEAKKRELEVQNSALEEQLAWLKRQIFGRKSERMIVMASGDQLAIDGLPPLDETPPDKKTTIKEYSRKTRRKTPLDGAVLEEGLRFDVSVPVEVIEIENPEVKDLSPDQYDVIGTKETHKLAQRPGSYVVLKYVRQVIKIKSTQVITCPKAPENVLEKSFADVSFLTGLLVDKFAYHLPLYRQHQRLSDMGIKVSRGTLTRLVHESIALLEPVYFAIRSSILQSSVITMDETPIKVGRDPKKKAMKTAYFWPIYGEEDEVAFIYAPTRSRGVIEDTLKSFGGTLLTDGYGAYESFIKHQNQAPPIGLDPSSPSESAGVTRAQCYVHVRREFVRASQTYPAPAQEVLAVIAALYQVEEELQSLDPADKKAQRQARSLPLVDQLFEILKRLQKQLTLLPSSSLSKAIAYALKREAELRVFLDQPEVPLDTNHLERQIRPIAVGRKNWMFCWTELGAQEVAIAQTLICSARLHGINPHTYLLDLLQRVETHKAFDVHLLTPKHWKQHFAQNPLTSNVSK